MTIMATKQHNWVKHTITPVMTLEGDDGDPVIFVDPEQQAISEDGAVYGCTECGEPLVGNYNTECKGEWD
jgi:hypothetical protein